MSEAVREALEWLCFEHQPKMCATCTRSWGDHPPDFATCAAETDCLFGAALATLTAATSTPQEGLACLVERCGCDGSAPCGQDDISECVPAVRVQCVECARLDTSGCLYADEHMVDDGCWFDARNASRPKVAHPTVPQEVVEAWDDVEQALDILAFGAPYKRKTADPVHVRNRVEVMRRFIRGEATDASTSGNYSIAACLGLGSVAMASADDGCIVIAWWDGTRKRISVGYVGENVEAGIPYMCDKNGIIVPAVDLDTPTPEYITIGDRRYRKDEVESALSGLVSEPTD